MIFFGLMSFSWVCWPAFSPGFSLVVSSLFSIIRAFFSTCLLLSSGLSSLRGLSVLPPSSLLNSDSDGIEEYFSHRVIAERIREQHEAVLVVRPGGVAVKRIPDTVLRRSPTPDALRGAIYGRSSKSNRRLMDQLSRVDLGPCVAERLNVTHSRLLFVTLTYPAAFPNGLDAKPHLKAFRKRLQRRYSSFAWALWVEEFQRRGAPHFHLVLCFGHRVSLVDFRAWASRAWYEVVGSDDPAHLRAGVGSVPVHFGKGVASFMSYLAKEISKGKAKSYQALGVDQETGEVLPSGRTWGWWCVEAVPFVTICNILISSRAAWARFKRSVADFFDSSPYLSRVSDMASWGGALLYGDGLELLDSLMPSEGWRYVEAGF